MMETKDLLKTENFSCSVSSVLNKNTRKHGKKFLYDQRDDTAWSSDEGAPQWISIEFDKPQTINGFLIQFQGGFAAHEGQIEIINDNSLTIYEEVFFADDINTEQKFMLQTPQQNVKSVRVIIHKSTDFFGRLIVYKLQLF